MSDDDMIRALPAVQPDAADRIEALTAKCEALGREVNMAKYGQPDFAWSIHVEAMADLEADNARLREALSLIAAMGFSDDTRVSANIARMAVHQARAALTGKETK